MYNLGKIPVLVIYLLVGNYFIVIVARKYFRPTNISLLDEFIEKSNLEMSHDIINFMFIN